VKKALLLAAVATVATLMPMTMTNAAPQTPASLQQFARCAASNYEGAELLATQPGSELKRQADDYNNAKTVCVTRFREGCLIQ
jgi:hypothetical protein